MLMKRRVSFVLLLGCALAANQLQSATWKVSRNVVTGPSGFTNAVTITAEQMTDLPDGIRSRVYRQTPDGVSTQTEVSFDSSNLEIETIDSNVRGTQITRRLHGLEIETETPDGTVYKDYDEFGRVVRVSRRDSGGNVTVPVCRMTYTPLSDLAKLETYTSATEVVSERYEYDALGNKAVVIDALGHVAQSVYDPFGHVVSVCGATMPLRFEYNSLGLRKALYTTRDGRTWDGTFWKYNPWTQKIVEKKMANGTVTSYSYTPDGLPVRTTFPDGRWMKLSYNGHRKVSAVEYSGGSGHSILYDEFDMPIRVVGSGGEVYLYCYGINSVLTNEIRHMGSESSELVRSYDACSRPIGLVHSINSVIQSSLECEYDAMNRIRQVFVTDGSGKHFVVSYTNAFGFGCGYSITGDAGLILERRVGRDPFRRELIVQCNTVTSHDTYRLSYAHDALGRVVARNDDSFAYDSRGQLISATVGGVLSTYQWDDAGNLQRETYLGITNNYVANELNQYSAISSESPNETVNLRYAVNGGLSDNGQQLFVYDEENRLVSVSPKSLTNGSSRVSYVYDYRSRRIGAVYETFDDTTDNWTTTELRDYYYDDWNLIQETVKTVSSGSTNAVNWKYYWGCDVSGSLAGGGGVGGLVAVSCNGSFYFPVYDPLGNILRYVDESGIVVAKYSYSPFGKCISQDGPLAQTIPFRFSTKYYDGVSRLYYFDYRHYAPELKRWMTPDPSEERAGGNLYVFCNNAPTYSFDPNGLIRIPFITDQAKRQWEIVIREVLDRRGWTVAALLMRQSLEPSPSSLVFEEGSLVSGKIKNSPEYRKIIDSLVANQRAGLREYDSFAPIEYKTGDLFAGVGHATVYYKGTICKMNGRAKVDLDITVKDDYDFHFLIGYQKSSYDGVLATIANNMAWSDQYFDVITPYSWKATFKETRR